MLLFSCCNLVVSLFIRLFVRVRVVVVVDVLLLCCCFVVVALLY